MRITRRQVASAPFLVLAVVAAYGAVLSYQSVACPGEEISQAIATTAWAAFAAYFLWAYRLLVARAYTVLTIATLWAWQVLVLSPVAASVCSSLSQHGLWLKPLGLGFFGSTAGVAGLTAVTSMAVYWRFVILGQTSLDRKRKALGRCAAGAVVLFTALMVVSYWMAPELRSFYGDLGADLSPPTRVLLEGYPYMAVIAAPFMLVPVYFAVKARRHPHLLEPGLNAAIASLVAGTAAAGALVFAAYASTIKMCSCV